MHEEKKPPDAGRFWYEQWTVEAFGCVFLALGGHYFGSCGGIPLTEGRLACEIPVRAYLEGVCDAVEMELNVIS